MTPPVQPQPFSSENEASLRHVATPQPNPDFARLHQLGRDMRALAPYKDGDSELRLMYYDKRRLFLAESERLAAKRAQSTLEENREARDAGKFAAGITGAIEGLSGVAGAGLGAKVGALAGTAVAPGPGTAVGTVAGGLIGGLAGMIGGRRVPTVSPDVSKEDVDATLDANPWFHVGGQVAGGTGPFLGRFVGQKMGTAAANLTAAQARATTAQVEARMAQATQNIDVTRKQAQTARALADQSFAELRAADEARRLANPNRAASISASHQRIRAEARQAVASADRAEWEAVMSMQRATGQLTVDQSMKLDLLGKKLIQENMRIFQMEQALEAGASKGETARKGVDILQARLLILEQDLTKVRAGASIAGEEAVLKVTTMREQLKRLQDILRQAGLTPEPMPARPGVTQLPL